MFKPTTLANSWATFGVALCVVSDAGPTQLWHEPDSKITEEG